MALAGLGTALLGGLKTIGGKVAGSKLGTMASSLGGKIAGSKIGSAIGNFGNTIASKNTWDNFNKLFPNGSGGNSVLPNLAMLMSTTAQSPGRYYVNSQWRGNGLAQSGLGYLSNPKYQNPYDQANLLVDLMNKKNSNNKYDITGSAFNNDISQAGNWFNKQDYNYNGIDTSLPTAGYYKRPDWMQSYFQ